MGESLGAPDVGLSRGDGGVRRRAAAGPLLCLLAAVAGLYLALVASPVASDSRTRLSADSMAFVGHAWLLEAGLWAYRDFSAAWGPVPQAIARLAVASRPDGDFLSAGPMIYFLLRAVGVVALALWVAWLPLARGGLVLVPLAAFAWTLQTSSHAVFRIGFALLALRACAAVLTAADGTVRPRAVVAAALLLVGTGLCSLDVLVYALLALVGAAAAAWALDRNRRRRIVVRTGAILGGFVGAGGALFAFAAATAVAGRNGSVTALGEVFARAATFSQVFGRPLEAAWPAIALWTALPLAAVGLSLAGARDGAEPLRFDLLLLSVFALLALKSAVTRADPGHVAFGLTATLALLSLLPALRALGANARAARLALVALALVAWPAPTLASGAPFAESVDPVASWRALAVRPIAPELLPRELLTAARRGDGPLFVFPLHAGWAAAAGRPLVAPVDQAYGAHTPASQAAAVAALEAAGAGLEVIYGLDGLTSWRVDGVPAITRTPVLAEYLLAGFVREPRAILDGGYLLLRRRAVPRRLAWRPIATRSRAAGDAVELAWQPATRCPLYRLGLELRYPARYRLGWAAGVRVRGEGAGETRLRTRLVALEVDRPFVTWLSPLGPRNFATLFDDAAPAPVPELDRLIFEGETTGPFGVAPGEIRPLRLDCLVAEGGDR